jgi:hypothetical protein
MTTPTPYSGPAGPAERAIGMAEADEPAAPSLRELAADVDPDEAREAGLPGQVIRVVLDDGTAFEVRTLNKDYIRWDKTPPARRGNIKNFQDAPFVFATFLAWSAARRLDQTALTFDEFADRADVVERVRAVEVPPTQ